MFPRSFVLLAIVALLLISQIAQAQSDEYEFNRQLRGSKPKFIRFGRAGAKFIRFGRAGINTWDDSVADQLIDDADDDIVKRAGAKFIRFG